MDADVQIPNGDSTGTESDARNLAKQRFFQAVQKGDFRKASTMATQPSGLEETEDKQLRKDFSDRLSIDPVALIVFALCFTVLAILAIASLFH